MPSRESSSHPKGEDRRPLWMLAAATFVIFFQGLVIAPLIPLFSRTFEAPEQFVGLVMPGYREPGGDPGAVQWVSAAPL
jgi:predicted MFS family arabinose efflux permease